MTDLIDLLENEFSEDKFKQGVIRTFQRVGNIPNDDGSWALYERAQSTGTMNRLELSMRIILIWMILKQCSII